MALEELLLEAAKITYSPRTLRLSISPSLRTKLSPCANEFLDSVFGKDANPIAPIFSAKWMEKPETIESFYRYREDVRLEILTYLTLFVHEFTHRIDFLITPFGLQYYGHSLREYWRLQEFIPAILDDPTTVGHVKFLADVAPNLPSNSIVELLGLRQSWESLSRILHVFYAWGDVSDIKPLKRFIKEGWHNTTFTGTDLFGVGVNFVPITVLDCFETFRVGDDESWYLRPLTIFETKAVVNSLLFIFRMLGDRAPDACAEYFETVYLRRKSDLPPDYFFLLDLGARLYDYDDFAALLKTRNHAMLKSMLIILSGISWYALQASPLQEDEDRRFANPILRLWFAFCYFYGAVRGGGKPFANVAEGLLHVERSPLAKKYFQKPITTVVPWCAEVIDWLIKSNKERTWHPDVKDHFHHIFTIMRPHFAGREPTYVSRMGMPDDGSPLLGCRSATDWEVTYTDYESPAAVVDWFDIRTDLFFNMLLPPDSVLLRLDAHFQAYEFPYHCECHGGITIQFLSRFATEYRVKCGYCGKEKALDRDDFMYSIVVKDTAAESQ